MGCGKTSSIGLRQIQQLPISYRWLGQLTYNIYIQYLLEEAIINDQVHEHITENRASV